jgi:hypothetical protein
LDEETGAHAQDGPAIEVQAIPLATNLISNEVGIGICDALNIDVIGEQ